MKPTVLLVDDEQPILYSLRRLLYPQPYDVLTANDAAQALDILAKQPVAVVVSDHKMPYMEGTEFLAIVAHKYPMTVRMMLTGQADLEIALKAINHGEIFRLLTKPCSEHELVIAIRHALQHHELLGQARRMLATLRMQASYIEHLERDNPGISEVRKDRHGAIVLDDVPCETEALLRQISAEWGEK